MLKTAIYCRLSEEDRNKANPDDDSNSIQNQKTMLLQYAIERGWEVYNIYSDDDYAGADRNRPAFNQLLQDAEKRKFDVVLCKTQSRFTREMELVEKYIHGLFPLWGVRFVSIVDNADTANKGNKKSRQINGLVNEWYLEDMSDNIKSVLTSRRLQGKHIGSFALYGYKKDPDEKGHLIIDEEAATVVREVFSLFAQGYGKTKIARMLNSRGIPNPTEYKRQHGMRWTAPPGKNGTSWKYSSIDNMLRNEMYIGSMVQGRAESISYKTKVVKPRPKDLWYVVKGTHEPIIEMELWNKVQAKLKEKAKPFITGEIGPFAKKLRCGYCGYTLRTGKKQELRYYQCPNHHFNKESCQGSFIAYERLEQTILEELRKLSELYLDKDAVADRLEMNNELIHRRDRLHQDIETFRKKSAEFTKGIQDLYMDKVKGLIGEDDFVSMSGVFKEERSRLDSLIIETSLQIDELQQHIDNGLNRRDIVEKYTQIDHLTREMIDELISYIVVYRRIPGTRTVPIEVHWKF